MTKKKTRSSLCNPVMFGLVMKDEDLFRELLSRILPDRKIRSLHLHESDEDPVPDGRGTFLHTEQNIMINPYAKSVRFDVLFEDDDTWFDVEMQTTDTRSLPQRSRYYHAAATVDSLARGREYQELKPGYVIFICLFDLFRMDQPIYAFEMCDRKNRLLLQDGQFTMFINTACRKDDIPEGLKNLFQYLDEGTVAESDPWIARLQYAVKNMEQEKEVRNKMTLYEEWVRTACTMERIKKSLEATKDELKSKALDLEYAENELKSKALDLEATKDELKSKTQDLREAEAAQQRFEAMTRYLLQQGRTEELEKALDDADYRNLLFEELKL